MTLCSEFILWHRAYKGDRSVIRIVRTSLEFDRESLRAPFGFKGGSLSELWQTIALLESDTGERSLGLGVQSVLWSDPNVFTTYSEAAGNSLMFACTAYALRAVREIPFETPLDLLEELLPLTLSYGKTITGIATLRETFALNALVPIDYAAWRLYARCHNLTDFDALIPSMARSALSARHDRVRSVPTVGYGVPLESVTKLVEDGYTLLKIKVGSDPDKDGDQEKMLAWDIARMEAIHQSIGQMQSGTVRYYLDANGRYDSKDRVLRLTDALEKRGALAQTLLLEEPLPEENQSDVRDIPLCIVADESAHTDGDALARTQMGYGAIALKPIAKTLSMSFRIANMAEIYDTPCFCADLTVNPVMVDWNKLIACRLLALPGLDCGLMETNGAQNYRDWERLRSYHPMSDAAWTQENRSFFMLDADFYASSGGFFTESAYYTKRASH